MVRLEDLNKSLHRPKTVNRIQSDVKVVTD